MIVMSDDFNRDGPGTENYSPSLTREDGVLLYRTRSMHKIPPNGTPMVAGVVGNLMPPDPSTGGEYGQPSQLGWSDGFGKAIAKATSFTGRVITRPNMGVHPREGHVGYSTRTQRLRDRVLALYTDYTPSNQTVAREVIEGSANNGGRR